MDDFVSKPVTPMAIREALRRVASATSSDTDGSGSDAQDSAILSAQLLALRALGSRGGSDLLQRVVDLYARDSRQGLAALEAGRQAVAAEREEARMELAGLAHKLAGGSLNVGAHRVAALCRILERDATRLSGDETADLLTQLEREVGLANAALARALLEEDVETSSR